MIKLTIRKELRENKVIKGNRNNRIKRKVEQKYNKRIIGVKIAKVKG